MTKFVDTRTEVEVKNKTVFKYFASTVSKELKKATRQPKDFDKVKLLGQSIDGLDIFACNEATSSATLIYYGHAGDEFK